MRYRKLDSDGDHVFGHGASDFWQNVPEAPAQAVRTRLMLFQGEWFLDVLEGMPWKTEVLGNRTTNTRDPAIRSHTLLTQGVLQIDDYSSNLDRETRQMSVQMTITTVYGQAAVTGVFL